MIKINLKDYYDFYESDHIVEIPKETAKLLIDMKRKELNYIRRMYWNKAHYSLDRNDGIENSAIFLPLSPEQEYEQKVNRHIINKAFYALTETQQRRIYAHYILELSQTDIALIEGVKLSSINESICKGLKKMNKLLKKFSL